MVHDSHAIKPVGWNGIQFSLPEQWDVIVKGNCHLIVEQELQPLLEFRWQNRPRHSSKKNGAEHIFSQLRRETGEKPQIIDLPPFLQALAPHFRVSTFTFGDHSEAQGAVITCLKSGTLILLQFFDITPASAERLLFFFKTLSCCTKDEQNMSWSIDGLTFLLPPKFTLENYSFSLDLTQFHFTSRFTALWFCRLAAASKHLERYTLKRLFASFSGAEPERCTVIDDDTIVFNSSPSIGDRLLCAIKRKKIHQWGTFCHHAEQDKILGLHVTSSQPLDRDQLTLLEKNYGFLQ